MRKLHQRVFGKWNWSFEVWFRIAWKVCDIWNQMVTVQLPTSVIIASVWASSVFLSLFCYKSELYHMEDSEHPMILPSSDNFETNCSPLLEMPANRTREYNLTQSDLSNKNPYNLSVFHMCVLCVQLSNSKTWSTLFPASLFLCFQLPDICTNLCFICIMYSLQTNFLRTSFLRTISKVLLSLLTIYRNYHGNLLTGILYPCLILCSFISHNATRIIFLSSRCPYLCFPVATEQRFVFSFIEQTLIWPPFFSSMSMSSWNLAKELWSLSDPTFT